MGTTIHVVMFPWFAFGHISPFIQLANKLSMDPTIKITLLSAPANIPRISSSLISTVEIIPVQIPPVDGIPPGIESTAEMTLLQAELLKKALDNMKPDIDTLLTHLRPHAIFYDFAQHWIPSIAAPLNIKSFFFSVYGAFVSAFYLVPTWLSSSQNTPTIEDLKNPPPGFPPTPQLAVKTYEALDILSIFKNFDGISGYERFIESANSSSAIVLKTCMEMEAPYVKFFRALYNKPVLVAGPLIPPPPTASLDQNWADWLGRFPEKSVVFCSFGSESFLKDDHIRELLLGLEMAGPPFLVVLNFPSGEDSETRLKAALPDGFEERVKDKGVVRTGWVQQQHILAHVSVGCFVCHAGLSSVNEALVSDCQLVLLPQKVDQFFNSTLVGRVLKAGIEVKREDESGYFGREDLCEAVKVVMERVEEEPGKTIRENQAKMKDFLRAADAHENFINGFVRSVKEIVCG